MMQTHKNIIQNVTHADNLISKKTSNKEIFITSLQVVIKMT